MMQSKLFLIVGCLFAGSGVVLGAFGAHALKNKLTENLMNAFQTGVHYQLIHAIALLVVGLLAQRIESNLLTASGWLLLLGTVMFSGSLYILALTTMRWAGPVTPLGGVAFIAGWLCLALAIWRAPL